MIVNALVVDVEHWYSPELLRRNSAAEEIDQFPESITPILDVLRRNKTTATFAILGTVAEKHPGLIRQLYDEGHEIATHAWSHKTLHELGKDGFDEEIRKSLALLESITGERPVGFRAPSFSIDNSTKWAFEILQKYGFEYDASIFPLKTMLYGVSNAPLQIYRPAKDDITNNDPNGRIVEFPMTVLKIGMNLPIAGGFYFRVLPLWLLKYGIRRVNEERPAILYIHPWETYPNTPRLNLPLFSRFVTYYGINRALKKFETLLKMFKFSSIRYVLENYYQL